VQRAYPVATIRALEAELMEQVGEDALMQRAAAGLAAAVGREARKLRGRLYGTPIMILVGPGNNGGDALYAGVRLARRGARVTAVRCLGEPHPAGLAAFRAAGGRLLDLADLDPMTDLVADVVVDGVLGIGGRPGLPERVALLAQALAGSGVSTVAVDLPSGVAADTGSVPGEAFQASRTVTFGGLKPCHLLEPGRSRCGEIELVDIGLPSASEPLSRYEESDVASGWPYPDERSDKYSRGVVGIDSGSNQYPGAGVLTAYGAVFGGAGMVRFLGAEVPAQLIRRQLPNVVFSPGRVQAHLYGSGWGDRPDGSELLATALDSGLPAVVDADGLRYLPDRVPANWLLTPHAGELGALLGEERSWVSEDPVRAVRAGVARTGATVLLKGASQLVAGPDHDGVEVAVPGPAWTGQAGSGDVLGGICAALLAAGCRAFQAAVLGASVQALTARRHPGPVPPHRLAELLPDEIARLERQAALG
jgi:hydroxyethylthiazole kinase-like uncharacterized protein yjeF